MDMHSSFALAARVLGAWVIGAACAGTQAAPKSCDELRASIEDGIRAKGVRDFTVSVVDAAASAPGQEVGRCEQGARKIMYARVREAAPGSPVAPPPKSKRDVVITECRDGRVITSGNCPN